MCIHAGEKTIARREIRLVSLPRRRSFFCIVHVKRVYLSVLSHRAQLCYPYLDAERARPAEVPQNPPPSLPSTSQCLSSLYIATSRFSFTFAAVTIYVGECSTSSTVSVTRVMCLIRVSLFRRRRSTWKERRKFFRRCFRKVLELFKQSYDKFARFYVFTVSSSAVENKICYGWCGENLIYLSYGNISTRLENSSFFSNRIVRVAKCCACDVWYFDAR